VFETPKYFDDQRDKRQHQRSNRNHWSYGRIQSHAFQYGLIVEEPNSQSMKSVGRR